MVKYMSFFGFGKKKEESNPQHITPTTPTTPTNDIVIDLKKDKISLRKNDTINLTKSDNQLSNIFVGVGWDPAVNGKNIDLDLSAHIYDNNGDHIITNYYGKLNTPGIVHSRDNLTGDGDGDDEFLKIALSSLPSNATRIELSITSFTNVLFKNIKNAYVRLEDEQTHKEFVRYDISETGGNHTALHVARFQKINNEWKFTAIGSYLNGRISLLDKNFSHI